MHNNPITQYTTDVLAFTFTPIDTSRDLRSTFGLTTRTVTH